MHMIRRTIGLAVLIAALMLSACALYRNDKCFLSDEQYGVARELFVQTGSIDLVQQRLTALQWLTCERNEAVYRLQKEFEVLPEELPAATAAP